LFGFQSQQHLAHPLAVNFCGDKVGHAVNKNGRSGVSSGSAPLRQSSSTEASIW